MDTIGCEKEFSDWLLQAGNVRSGTTINLLPSFFANTKNGEVTSLLKKAIIRPILKKSIFRPQ